jgi:hypothetical protein
MINHINSTIYKEEIDFARLSETISCIFFDHFLGFNAPDTISGSYPPCSDTIVLCLALRAASPSIIPTVVA